MRRRNSLRLRKRNYADPGFYFVTICAHNKEHIFGEVSEGTMLLNVFGQIAEMRWQWLEWFYPLQLSQWVIMPNHMHGIVVYEDMDSRSIIGEHDKPVSLGNLIGAYKTVTTKLINIARQTPRTKLWQRNFHDHIIRTEHDLNNIERYIMNNPLNWDSDSLNSYRKKGAQQRAPTNEL